MNSARNAARVGHILVAGEFLRAAVVALVILLPSATTFAADKLKAGDEIEVFFLNKWWPATVVSTNARGEVLAEYEFAGRPRREGFQQNQVRQKYELGAISKLRTWKDASGKFNIEAVLLSIEDNLVTLRKPDMTELQVPLDKLSAVDQAFAKRMATDAPPAFAKSLPIEKFAMTNSTPWNTSVQRTAIVADPLPAYVKFKEGGAAFPQAENSDDICAVIPVGGPDGWILAATKNPFDEKPSRLFWISTERSKVDGQQLLPGGEFVLDYHAPSHRLLTCAEVKNESGPGKTLAMTLWEVLPTDKGAKPVVRWDASSQAKDAPHDPWARLIDGNTVLHRFQEHQFVGWDAAKKEARYQINQESFFAPAPILSGGRKYLFLPSDEAVQIYDSATGRMVSVLPTKDGSTAIAVTSDGRRAAVLGRSTVTVWNLTDDSSEPQSYQAEAIGTPFDATLSWVGEDHLMAEAQGSGQLLYSLKHKLTLWRYEADFSSSVMAMGGERLSEIVADHLVYAAEVKGGANDGFGVGAARLPGPKVDELVASLDPDSLMILKPGSAVRIDARAGENNARITAAIERDVAANGWKLTPDASTVIIAEMKRGETKTVTYRLSDGRGGTQDQSASVTPYISELRIEVNGKIAWQTGTASGAPGVVGLKEGQSVQSEVDRWQHPNVEFYDTVDMPERIMDPTKRYGLGTSLVTNRGLIPQLEPNQESPGGRPFR